MNHMLLGLSAVCRGILAFPNRRASSAATAVHAMSANDDTLGARSAPGAEISMLDGVFNLSERQVQVKAGVSDEEIAGYQRYVEPTMPKQRTEFFQTRDIMYVTIESASGGPTAGLIAGNAGPPGESFSHANAHCDYTVLGSLFAVAFGMRRAPVEYLQRVMLGLHSEFTQVGRHIGFQALDHGTRRRHRANGRIVSISGHCIDVEVDQSFGACAMYINKRIVKFDASKMNSHSTPAIRSDSVTAEASSIIERADTFFLATSGRLEKAGGNNGVDISHRGGPSGFVEVSADGMQLKFPEYKGNNFFMSLGNIAATSVVDLMFVDYESGAAVIVSGRARIDWKDTTQPGSKRAVVVTVELCSHLPAGSLPIHASPVLEWSPHNPKASE